MDGRVAAEDDGTGSVNGWSELKQRVTTAEGQIVAAQNDISALDGTVSQQTTDISGLMTDVTNLTNNKQDRSLKFENVTASAWAEDTEFADYGYKCTIPLTGVTSTCYSDVVFSVVAATSGNYAPISRTYDGGVYIWGKVNDSIIIKVIVEVF